MLAPGQGANVSLHGEGLQNIGVAASTWGVIGMIELPVI